MIKLANVVRNYRMGKTLVPALRGVDLEIEEGEFVAIMGPSGSGKSTLMNLLGGLDLPDSGGVFCGDQELSRQPGNALAEFRGRKVGFVFQVFNLIPTFTALRNVELPLVFQGLPRRERHARARQVLEQVGLGDRAHHRPGELSGGEQQRVAIARAMVNSPEILLCDEPTGNLDSTTGAQIMDLLAKLNRENGVTVIVVTHELEIARYARRTIHMRDGRVAAQDVNHHREEG